MNTLPPTRRLTLGVMGHVDHGKTALVEALTGMDTDRLPEEKRRGVSIALGFAHAEIGGVEVDFIDMPGHERFVRTLVSGATGVDAALLVVAANEGVKPQTLEHLHIAALLGVRQVLLVLSKADLAAEEEIAELAGRIEGVCGAAGAQVLAPVAVSVREGCGLDTLRTAVAALATPLAAARVGGFPWLPLDRAFTMAGRGTVATGTLRRGRLAADTDLVLYPDLRPVRVRGLQVHGRPVEAAEPGQRVAVALRDLDPREVLRGSALAPPGALEPAHRLTVTVRSLAEAPPLRNGAHLALLIGSTEAQVRMRLLEGDEVAPGASAFAQLEAAAPIAAPAGERFILRRPSPAMTVGGGEVIDPAAPRLRRGDPMEITRVRTLAAAPLRMRPVQLLADADLRGVNLRRLALIAGEAPETLLERMQGLDAVRVDDGLVVAEPAVGVLQDGLVTALVDGLVEHPNGMTRAALAALHPEAAAPILDLALRGLVDAGRLRFEGALVRLPPPRDQARAEADRALAAARTLAERLRQAALRPPDLGDLAPTPATRRVLEALVKAGLAVKTLDRVQKRELAFHREAVAAACATLAPHLAPPGLTVGEVGALLGVSRKFSVPLLEYLDAVRFTRRLGDRRVLGPAGPPC